MKITSPGASPATVPLQAGAGHYARRARAAAAEARLTAYTRLACGHYASRDTTIFYSLWAAARNATWCEACDAWARPAPRRRPRQQPAQPPF